MELQHIADRTPEQVLNGVLITEVPEVEGGLSSSDDVQSDEVSNVVGFPQTRQHNPAEDYDDDTYDVGNESRSNSTASGGEKHSGSGDEVYSAIDGYWDGTTYDQKSKNSVKEKQTGSTQVSNAGYDVTGRLQQEDESESVEHASMDDLSDVFIDEIQQLETRDEDFDTDLEIDDQSKWPLPRLTFRDPHCVTDPL